MNLTELHIQMEEKQAEGLADAIARAPAPHPRFAQEANKLPLASGIWDFMSTFHPDESMAISNQFAWDPKLHGKRWFELPIDKRKQLLEHFRSTGQAKWGKELSNRNALYSEPGDTTQRRGTVYLLHFETPYHHARHYIGFTENLQNRLHTHDVNGNPLVHAVNEAGIPWRVSRIWEGVKQGFEHYIKSQKNVKRFCPICQMEQQTALGNRKANREPSKICVMAKLDDNKILDVVKSIPEDDLYKEGDEFGRELDVHVTILYGLDPEEVSLEDVKKVLATTESIEITLGKISKFEDEDKPYDVLKIDVDSTDLKALNKKLRKLPYENDYDDYHPHVTIAYVKKGKQETLVNNDRFEGETLQTNKVVFSPGGDGEKETISLGQKREAQWGQLYSMLISPSGQIFTGTDHLALAKQLFPNDKIIDTLSIVDEFDEYITRKLGYAMATMEKYPKKQVQFLSNASPKQKKAVQDWALENGYEFEDVSYGKTKYYAFLD